MDLKQDIFCIQIRAISNFEDIAKGTSRQWNGAIRKKFPLHKPRGWEKTKMTLRYLYQENIS